MLQQDSTIQGRTSGLDAGFNPADAPDPTQELLDDPTEELLALAAAASAVAVDDPAGGTLGSRYLLEEPLARGGTAIISRARDLQRDGGRNYGHIAIKMLRPELRFRPQSIARLQREFRQTSVLAHPNVVRHFGIGCDQGRWYIAMELLDGEALGRRLKTVRSAGLPAAEALGIAVACGDALAAAHDRGVIHGDIKPDNVFVTATNGVRVLDFGAAPDPASAAGAAPPAETTAPAATRAYASPQVLAGLPPEPQDDVFSLACVVYEMLAGRHPYGRTSAIEARDAGVAIERPPGLTSQQWLALAGGLAWNRESRPAQVRLLLRELAPEGVPVAALSPAPVAAPSQAPALASQGALPVSIGKRAAGVFAGGAALLVALAIVASWDGSQPHGQGPTEVPASGARAPASNEQTAPPVVPALPVTAAVVPAPAAAAPTRRVSFGTGAMQVSRGTVAAAIPIQIEPGRERVSVAWRVIGGSAVAGRDFGGPQSGVAVFQEGQTVRILYVPIVHDPSGGSDRSFTVELTKARGGATVGSPNRAVVTIQGS